MPRPVKPRRSMLYMPGSNARALEKARSLPADSLILDLEDAVAPDAKEQARAMVCEAVRAGGYGKREVVIRVNGLATPWGQQDIVAAARSGADGILLPKVEGPGIVRQVQSILEVNGAPDSMAVWCMVETPLGVLHAERIAGAGTRLAGLVMGTSDLAKDLHANHTPDRVPMITSLGLCLLAARAFGIAVVDGVHLDLADTEGFVRLCRQGADMGFDGKTLIHPNQIGPANEAFAPSSDSVEAARRIITAHREAEAEGKGVIVVDGRLVENLHVENARRVISLANAIAALAPDLEVSRLGARSP
ncbi:MAG: CoA ester lyase [Alphaproteobacteria bacterium]|nr:CoA ester lyase [Alphaproteobacteria bacterium]